VHPPNHDLILITLLVELGVAAAVASSLARSSQFKRLLVAERRSRRDLIKLLAWIVIPLMLGVWIRVRVPNFLAADLSFQATALMGLLLGPGPAMVGGAVLAVPALWHREVFALGANLAVALIFGNFRRFVGEDDVWSFSPLIDLSLYRWVRRTVEFPHLDRQIFLLVLLTAVQFALSVISHLRPRSLFALYSDHWLVELAICACAPVVVGIPLKIWNSVRIERKLEEQSRLLLEARLDALQRQINPHFLFNTLNSIASLIRSKPELAREMIVKLGNIMRVLLRDRDAFVPLGEELEFTDDYLAIEVVRFGDKLKVVKEIAEETLEIEVPSMLLQPLIENSIKHGIEPRISGGTVTLRSRVVGEKLVIEIEDDGVGMEPRSSVTAPVSGLVREGSGIGMRNVRERLEVLYGDSAQVELVSRPGRGTRVRLVMPVETAEEFMPKRSRATEPLRVL
jgi:two-component system LytT family sensor kinase